MTSFVQKVHYHYHYIMEELADPRTSGLPLANPVTLLTILAAYFYFCLKWGPNYMRDRKAYNLTSILIVYNILQVILSTYIFVVGFYTWCTSYNWTCQPLDFEVNPVTTLVHRLLWWYYFGKLTELLDTVFFVLRKKDNQVTFLHLYHHLSMPVFIYFGLRYYPNGHSFLLPILNCFVHIVMYTYYLIAGLGPQFQKYLWWKKHVTTIQLVQFAMIFVHNFIPLFASCNYPKFVHIMSCLNAMFLMFMFGKFYIKKYVSPKSKLNGTENSKKKTRTDFL